jgi:uncharacterized protein with ATP-grasp and redox domains
MSIPMDAQCVLCHINRNLSIGEKLGDSATCKAFAHDLMRAHLAAPEWASSPYLGPETDRLFQKHFGIGPDRYREDKIAANQFVKERLDQIRACAESAPDPVFAGLKLSILGNYLDFAALPGQVDLEKMEQMLAKALEMDLDREAYAGLCRDLEKGSKLLYLTDNAGEIGFDRIFAEAIHAKYPHIAITFCVRGGPALNDATREDAEAVGIPFPVIDNGNLVAGTQLELLSEEAKNAMDTADVIIAKGQANAETLLDSGYNIYYAFLVKCVRFIERFGKPKLTPMLVKERK